MERATEQAIAILRAEHRLRLALILVARGPFDHFSLCGQAVLRSLPGSERVKLEQVDWWSVYTTFRGGANDGPR